MKTLKMTTLMGLGKEFDFKVFTHKQKDLVHIPSTHEKKQEPSHICKPNERNTKPAKSLYQ